MGRKAVFLIIEGNTRAAGRLMARYGSPPFAEQYGAVLTDFWSGSQFDIVRPADGETALPPGRVMADYDGAVLTGSFLNVTSGGPEVDNQIALARSVFEAGVPFLGSCWGLQLAAAATGGTVRKAPKGRELGVARNITRTDAGTDHPFLDGRPKSWDALAVHQDEVERLPSGGVVLSSNPHSAIQAAEIQYANGVFWGVQVHPEFDLPEMGATLLRAASALIEEGFFENQSDLEKMAADYRALGSADCNKAIRWRLGVSTEVLETPRRRLEIGNWLTHLVAPRMAKTGRG